MKIFYFLIIIFVLFSCNTKRTNSSVQKDSDIVFMPNKEALVKLIKDSIGEFRIYDSIKIDIDRYARGYLWIVIPNDQTDAIIVACKYAKNGITVLDVNENILKDEPLFSDNNLYALYKDGLKTIVLSAQNYPTDYYFRFEPNGIYVDSIVLLRKIYETDRVAVEKAVINKPPFGKIRLQNYTDDIWDASDVHYIRQEK
jgi:hypothetical protein